MHHFFVNQENISGGSIRLSGEDYNHAVRVLRLRPGEEILVSDGEGRDYTCIVEELEEAQRVLKVRITDKCAENHELPSRVWLFQALPKADKMELIIQKAVELGVSEIVPVQTKNCVVKLDAARAAGKVKRWQAIAEAAAKQSKRSIVPVVHEPVDLRTAAEMMGQTDVPLIPYEEENGIVGLAEAIISFLPGRSISVLIGPEGGFDPLEVSLCRRHGIRPVSLGKRILRTETAAIAALSLIMIRLEIASEIDMEN